MAKNFEQLAGTGDQETGNLKQERKNLLEQIGEIGNKKWNIIDLAAERYCDDLLEAAGIFPEDIERQVSVGELAEEIPAVIKNKITDPDDRLLLFVKKLNGGLAAWAKQDKTKNEKLLAAFGIDNKKVIAIDQDLGFYKLPTPIDDLYQRMEDKLLEKVSEEEQAQLTAWNTELKKFHEHLSDIERRLALESQDPGI